MILGDLDVIGINAFYPLADNDGAPLAELLAGGERVRAKVHAPRRDVAQAGALHRDRLHDARRSARCSPWEWPDAMKGVKVDELAQADAYHALIAPLLDEPYFAGFFVWRVYADPDDVSQEAEWGFSPRGKLAELVLRDAFRAAWAADPERPPGWPLAAETPGVWP